MIATKTAQQGDVILRRIESLPEPNFSWGADGFMAATRDKRGNEVQLEQENGKWAIQKYQSQEAA